MARRGPRPRGDYGGKGATLSARITTKTRERLIVAAQANNRSISSELEARLAQSFGKDADLRDFGTDQTFSLLRLVDEGIRDSEALVGKTWIEDPFSFDLMAEVARLFMDALRPRGKRVPPNTFPNLEYLNNFPDVKQGIRAHLAKQSSRALAYPLAASVIARLQGAAASGSVEFGIFQQVAGALAPHISAPVLPLVRSGGDQQ